MKLSKAKILLILTLCFAVSNIANAFACPMMIQSEKTNHIIEQNTSTHCQEMQTSKKMSDTNCDSCKCMNCLQIVNNNFSSTYKAFKFSESINPTNKNYNDFKSLLLSPPPKIS